jgi:HEAT repeat protein
MMGATLLLLLLGGGFVAGALGGRRRFKRWQGAVESCGLQILGSSASLSPFLRAQAGSLKVQIESSRISALPTRIGVRPPGPEGFYRVRIGADTKLRERPIGDESFDREFFISGPAPLVSALLDEGTRSLFFQIHREGRLKLADGELQADLSDEKVARVLPLLLELGRRFGRPLDIPQRLADNAGEDSVPGVRLESLRLLIQDFRDEPRTAAALRKACSDPRPEIRLYAAKALGSEGRAVLPELAENPEDDAVSAQAVWLLDRELPLERVNAILKLALRQRRLRTAEACLKTIGRRGAAGIERLAEALERESGDLALAAARALGQTGSPGAEAPLIRALEREDADLRVAAAEELGRVGSTAAVLPLQELSERFVLGEIRRATRQAIADIQARLQGASPGQLSLAGTEAGQLSLAQDGGELSLAPDPAETPAGRLSLESGEGR